MTSNICQRLINQDWLSYADDLDLVPDSEGIYAIGDEEEILYVGQSNNILRRLREHKYGQQEIDKFVKKQFKENGGVNLQIKWVEDPDAKCKENDYLKCLARKLGYWPEFNVKGGNNCQ